MLVVKYSIRVPGGPVLRAGLLVQEVERVGAMVKVRYPRHPDRPGDTRTEATAFLPAEAVRLHTEPSEEW